MIPLVGCVAICLSLLTPVAAKTACLSVTADRTDERESPDPDKPWWFILVSVTNNCGGDFKMVEVECAWLKGGEAVGVDHSQVYNLLKGDTARTEIFTNKHGAAFDSVNCRIGDVYEAN